MRAPLRSLPVVTVAVLAAWAAGLVTAVPAHADTVLTHEDWSCAAPYSGALQCAPPVSVPPGGYLWIGDDTGGPTVFTVYQGSEGQQSQVGWIEMTRGEGRAFTNTTGTAVLVHVTVHEDAPTDRCGSKPEHGFIEVRE